MKNYDVILFDLDGTLTDSSPGIINSIIYALNKYGISVEDTSKLRRFLGPPLHESFKEFYGFDDEKAMEAVKYYREYFSTKGLLENQVYNGIPELLKNIADSFRKRCPWFLRIMGNVFLSVARSFGRLCRIEEKRKGRLLERNSL